MSSCTTKPKKVVGKNNRTVLDSPGFNDSNNSLVTEAQIYDDLLRSLLPEKICCILFLWAKDDRLKSFDQDNLLMFGSFPNEIPKAIVVTHFQLINKKPIQELKQELKDTFMNHMYETLAELPVFVTNAALYNPEDDYQDLKDLPKFSKKHKENEENFQMLLRFIAECGEGKLHQASLLKMLKENPFKLKIEGIIEGKMVRIIKDHQDTLMEKVEAEFTKGMSDDEFHSSLEDLKKNCFQGVLKCYEAQIEEGYRKILSLDVLSFHKNFQEEVVNQLNQKYISYVKARQRTVLKDITLGMVRKVTRQANQFYQQTNNPFQTISLLNDFWDKQQAELAQKNLSDAEAIEIFEATKAHVEEELKGFRDLIFGNAYAGALKATALGWGTEVAHLSHDSYKDLHNLTIVKCPGCSYPWGNHGMCPYRTCLFCLTKFQWNLAERVMRQDWDSYDYSPALLPKVGKNESVQTRGTLVVTNLKTK